MVEEEFGMGRTYVERNVRDPRREKIRDLANAGVKSRFNPGARYARRRTKQDYRAKSKWSGERRDPILDKIDNLGVLERWTRRTAPTFGTSDEFHSFVVREFRGSFAARHAAQHILENAPRWLGCTCVASGSRNVFARWQCRCGAFGVGS
jgi:hypothetical protein